jgi:hypothetical protein
MENEKQRRAIGRPFVRGDVRINRTGRPKSFDELRKLAQQIGHEKVRDSNGVTLTVAEAVLRKLVQSNDPHALRIFLEYGYGKPVDKIETNLEPRTTLRLFYGHEREQRRLLDGNCE